MNIRVPMDLNNDQNGGKKTSRCAYNIRTSNSPKPNLYLPSSKVTAAYVSERYHSMAQSTCIDNSFQNHVYHKEFKTNASVFMLSHSAKQSEPSMNVLGLAFDLNCKDLNNNVTM